MLNALHRKYVQLLTSGAQLLLLVLGIHLHSRNAWVYCLAAIASISVIAWLSSLSRLRAIRNTPTSRIASAAQGYVELIGRGEPYCNPPLLSPLSRRPCLWCRYRVEQRSDHDKWKQVESGETIDSFLLRDESGEVVIDPDQAEIVTRHHEQWLDDGYRYTEWKLLLQDALYVIGQFGTRGGSTLEFDDRAELNDLLLEWKKDKAALLARFDLNKDGELDAEEWSAAVEAAKREVEKTRREFQAQPDTHYISRPADGKPYLISNLSSERLSRRYLLWAWAHLAIFFGSLSGIGWILQQFGG